MTFRSVKHLAILACVALSLAVGGSRANADLTLDVSVAGGPTINIDSSTGNFSFTNSVNGTFVFKINGDTTTIVYTGGTYNGTFADSADDTATFQAKGANGQSLFGGYAINSLSAAEQQGSSASHVFDTTTDVGGTGTSSNALQVNAAYGFTQPSSPVVTLESVLAPTAMGGGKVTFLSTIGATSTTLLSTTTTNSQTTDTTATPPSNPYQVSNTLTLSGLGNTQSDNISATTNVYATPEPTTMLSALVGLGCIQGAGWIRRRRNVQA